MYVCMYGVLDLYNYRLHMEFSKEKVTLNVLSILKLKRILKNINTY